MTVAVHCEFVLPLEHAAMVVFSTPSVGMGESWSIKCVRVEPWLSAGLATLKLSVREVDSLVLTCSTFGAGGTSSAVAMLPVDDQPDQLPSTSPLTSIVYVSPGVRLSDGWAAALKVCVSEEVRKVVNGTGRVPDL